MSKREKIIIVDFGSQYSHLISRRIRELNVYSEIVQPDAPLCVFRQASGIILSGGPSSVYESGAPSIDSQIFSFGLPVLGICYGHQLMAYLLGGKINKAKEREYGFSKISVKQDARLFNRLASSELVWMSHGDSVGKLPAGFKAIASTGDCPVAAMADERKNLYGLQFHPEVTDTAKGKQILNNFVYDICGCRGEWKMEDFIVEASKKLKSQAVGKKIFVFVSGGVDSAVVFTLFNKVLGEKQVYGFHVDNGFMRKGESKKIEEALIRLLGYDNFHVINAEDKFLQALKGVTDPEEKRKIIGRVFISVFHDEIKKLKLGSQDWILGQGTIYPDTIESGGTKQSAKIKTHHNQVEEVKQMINDGRVLEPLRELYKDEVREVGQKLGLPDEIVFRHPFPGPGLAVQTLCSDGQEKPLANRLAVDRKIKKILLSEGFSDIRHFVLPVKSVGVQGDFRTYAHPVALFQQTTDYSWLTKNWSHLEKLSTLIANELKEINRVVFLLGGDNIEQIKLQRAYLTKERLNLLREVHACVDSYVQRGGWQRKIWEMPIVLLPAGCDNKESVVLRPLNSEDAMTIRFARLPQKMLGSITTDLLAKPGISHVFYDITNKPPGMVQWE